MSPVMTNVYDAFTLLGGDIGGIAGVGGLAAPGVMVVSSVLGSVLLKMHASSVSFVILATISSIAASTDVLTKRRSAGGGRRLLQSADALPRSRSSSMASREPRAVNKALNHSVFTVSSALPCISRKSSHSQCMFAKSHTFAITHKKRSSVPHTLRTAPFNCYN